MLPAWGRDPPGLRGLGPNLRAAARAVRDARPLLVATTGAGLVVPFALMARGAGARLVLVESMARVTDASLTARILAPLAGAVVVQWPEMREVLRGARVCRPALLDAAGGEAPGPDGARDRGQGTFVSVGTRPEPFDRLLAMVDRSVARGLLPRPVVAQSGVSRYRPRSYSTRPWMAPDELSRRDMRRSLRGVPRRRGDGVGSGRGRPPAARPPPAGRGRRAPDRAPGPARREARGGGGGGGPGWRDRRAELPCRRRAVGGRWGRRRVAIRGGGAPARGRGRASTLSDVLAGPDRRGRARHLPH